MRKLIVPALMALLGGMMFAWAQQTAPNTIVGGIYNATPPSLAPSQQAPVQLDASGNLKVNSSGSTIGGYDFFTSVTPTVQNAQYVPGNCMGGFQPISVGSTAGLSGILNKITMISKGADTAAKQLYVFTSNPSSSTCTDKGAFTIAAADLPKWIATLPMTLAVPSGGAASEAEASSLGDHFVTSGNTDLYVAIVEAATSTPASTSDLLLNIGGIKDQP